MRKALKFGTFIPWACSYKKDGRRFGITLYSIDDETIIENWSNELENLAVDGRLLATVDWKDV